MRLSRLIIFLSPIILFLASLLFSVPVLLSPSHPVDIDDIDYEEIKRLYGITFPIPELGNCATFTECLSYCSDPVNYSACIDYAKDKGFYKEEDIDLEDEMFWNKTREELGCDSYQSCQAYCELPENYEVCNDFARRNNLIGGYEEDTAKEEILGKAREYLGCDSYTSCRAYCEDPANYQRCDELASAIGLRGGQYQRGPGGCGSEESCRDYCSDPNNYDVCLQYASTRGYSFEGPGGCNSEASCREYCSSHTEECRYFGEESVNPEDFCKKYPQKCAEFGGGTDWKKFEKYCLESPEACSGGGFGRSEVYKDFCTQNSGECEIGPGGYPIPKYKSGWEESSGDYCSKYPEKCEYYKNFDPKTECTKYEGCSWTGTTCECFVAGPYYPGQGEGGEDYDPANECAKQTGCSWTGTYCQCEGGTYQPPSGGTYCQPPSTGCASGSYWDYGSCSCKTSDYQYQEPQSCPGGYYWSGSTCVKSEGSYDPATECAKQAGCTWAGSSCQCSQELYPSPTPGVYGAATAVAGWFTRLLQFFFGR